MLKKSYAIELDENQEKFLKVRFGCQTDGELRNILQKIALLLITRQLDVETKMQSPSSQDKEVK